MVVVHLSRGPMSARAWPRGHPERTGIPVRWSRIRPWGRPLGRTTPQRTTDRAMKTVLYCRVSTLDQTLDHQLTQAQAAGFGVDEVVADHGISGVHTACMGLSLSRVHHATFVLLLLHSFVRPAPRVFFHPDRILPSPSRAAMVKDGASSAPPKACP